MRRLNFRPLVVVAGLLFAACGGASQPEPAAGLATREVSAGEVTVTITPTRLDSRSAEFAIAFDTHSVDLGLDVADSAALTVDDRAWGGASWDGPGPGGHHREGTLRFEQQGPAAGEAVLTLSGLPEPVTARWDLQEKG